MYKTNPLLIEKSRTLREKGVTLGKIVLATQLPKTTVYDHIRDISLPLEIKEKIKREARKRINEYIRKERKGKCIPGRIVLKPKGWTNGLTSLTAHFMFDGEIKTGSCIYHNRSEALIDRIRYLMERIFSLHPRNSLNKDTDVYRISYHYVELADYIRKKTKELRQHIKTFSPVKKKIFLQAFFDDEGSVHFDKKIARGFQHNLETLELIHDLLQDFDIQSRIDENYKEIIISRKPNLIKFQNKINFSKGVYINPDRKNSIWKKKLEKREILDKIIKSYKK